MKSAVAMELCKGMANDAFSWSKLDSGDSISFKKHKQKSADQLSEKQKYQTTSTCKTTFFGVRDYQQCLLFEL